MSQLAKALIGLERIMAGVKRHTVQLGDHNVVYSEGGKGETVLLFHGFGASGDSWNRLAASLTKKYRVIAPDLPGWGASTRIESASYAYPAQIERAHAFVQALQLKRFHLIGHSMGGFLAAAYAARFPEEIVSLGLVAPHGMAEPMSSDLAKSAEKGENWLVVTSLPNFDRLLNNLFVKRPYIPGPVVKYIGGLAVRNSAKSQKIFDELQQNEPALIDRLAKITAPAMIVWGDQDRVLHVSSAELFKSGIKQSELLILKDCGHMPVTEKLSAWAGPYAEFIKRSGQPRSGRVAASN